MQTLLGKVALVTGASRGIGKGIALGLGEAGATVYITGRTTEANQAAVDLPGTIHQTADEVAKLGGNASRSSAITGMTSRWRLYSVASARNKIGWIFW